MIITKVIETGIDFENPIDIYTDAETNIKALLDHTFQGKCFRGCLILNIKNIKQISECVMVRRGSHCGGHVDIRFEADVIVYAKNEIINGCVIQNRDRTSGIIIAQSKHANICLNNHASLDNVEIGQMISVRVGEAKYTINAEKVSINARYYLPEITANIYHISSEVTDLSPLKDIIEATRAEEVQFKALIAKSPRGFELFKGINYPYAQEKTKDKNAQEQNLLKLTSFPAGYYVRDPASDLTTDIVYRYNTDPSNLHFTLIDAGSHLGFIAALYEDYRAYMKLITEMLTIYKTKEIIQTHMPWWRAIRKNKI